MTEPDISPASTRREACHAQATSLVQALSTPEKIRLVSGADFWHTEDLAGYAGIMLADGPHGLRKQDGASDHVGLADSLPATCFPPAVTLGSSWDTTLVEEVGAALGREARAQGVGVVLGPGLNIKRHPAGGRSFEYFSEDPVLSGTLAGAMVRGIQSEGTGACLKHFAVNNQEDNRMRVNVVVDDRTLHELYLRGFEIAVREGRPWTVMSSYNMVNGVHTGESRELLTAILRDTWGFDGLVMTDWLATFNRAQALDAGLDLEMPGSGGAWDKEVARALRRGDLAPERLDAAATRVAELIVRAHAEREARGSGVIDVDAHHELARRAAAAGTVLLSNNGLLPLAPAQGTTVAVIGAFATQPRYQGAGSSQVNPTRVDTFLEAFRTQVGPDVTVTFAPGYDAATGSSSADQVAVARDVAAGADTVIVLVGLPASAESEGYDRTTLALPADQDALVTAITEVNARTVVVLSNGSAVELPWAEAPGALVEAYLGGQASGSALADVILGVREPGGRLAESFPVHASDLPAQHNWPGSPTQVQYREGLYVGYRFHDTAGMLPRFPFGHGLSYTTFAWSRPKVTVTGEGAATQVTATITIKNTGTRAGSEVVQLYVHDVESTLHRPHQELVAYTKVFLEPGASERVTLTVDADALAVWDLGARHRVVEGGELEVRFAASSADVRAAVSIHVTSDAEVTPRAAVAAARPASLVASDQEFTAMLGHPIPAAAALLPYTVDSTIEDLSQTFTGRLLARIVRRAAGDAFGGDADPQSAVIFDAMFRQMPLRAVSMASQGALAMHHLRRVVGLLNATRWIR